MDGFHCNRVELFQWSLPLDQQVQNGFFLDDRRLVQQVQNTGHYIILHYKYNLYHGFFTRSGYRITFLNWFFFAKIIKTTTVPTEKL